MEWAKTMAGNAGDAANNEVPGDDSAQRDLVPGAWDPHQVWLTRVKQPRDGRHRPSNPPPAAMSPQSKLSHTWIRATR